VTRAPVGTTMPPSGGSFGPAGSQPDGVFGLRRERTPCPTSQVPSGASGGQRDPSQVPSGAGGPSGSSQMPSGVGGARRVLGFRRYPTRSSDSPKEGSRSGIAAIFGSRRCCDGRLEPSLLRYSMARDGEHAGSDGAFGPRRERRGRPSRRGLRVSTARNARSVRAGLRLWERWAATSGFPTGPRSRRRASGIARTTCGPRVTDRRADGPFSGHPLVFADAFGCSRMPAGLRGCLRVLADADGLRGRLRVVADAAGCSQVPPGAKTSGSMSDPRGSSDSRGEGSASHPTELRLLRIERAYGFGASVPVAGWSFGSKGPRSPRVSRRRDGDE
jgi:hypothetical protein